MIKETEYIVGKENLKFGSEIVDYRKNVSGLSRKIDLVVTPTNTSQIIRLVKLANETGLKLFPISSGRNWGLGSRLPVADNCIILDLQKMNSIIEVNERHGYAVIEPGVTQIQLYNYLQEKNSNYIFNTIGSGKETSLIGNALDRGIGYFSSRCENLTSLEVVLGNGETVRTGFSHFASSRVSSLYRHGVGPSLDGLFFQSNYGIVTKASLELISNKDYHAAIIISLKDDTKLPDYIDTLAELRKRGVLQTAFHIANKERARISITPLIFRRYIKRGYSSNEALIKAEETFESEFKNNWSAIGGILGTEEQVVFSYNTAKNFLKKIAEVKLITDKRIDIANKTASLLSSFDFFRRKKIVLDALETVYGYCRGIPSDSALDSVTWAADKTILERDNPDLSEAGLLYALPILPFDGKSLIECLEISGEIIKPYNLIPYMTFNMINDKCLEGVINIAYNRSDSTENTKAHQCIKRLNQAFIEKGFIPYRIGIYGMQDLIDPDDSYWRIVKDLKKVLDPNNVIAPMRYNQI